MVASSVSDTANGTADAQLPLSFLGTVKQRIAELPLAVLVVTALALALRLLGARGDLWVDEIWSLVLLKPLTSIDQIFWRINHDNNHFLNSVYLYLLGPGASPLAQRSLSIVLGVATVLAAAVAMAPRGRWTMVAASLLFSVSYPMVHYGSEARGYAGSVLFTLLGVVFLERRLEGRRGAGVALAATILLGTLSHLVMVEAAAVLVAWTAWLSFRRTGSLLRSSLDVILVFWPAALAVLPLALCMIVGDRLFGFTVGGFSPFSLSAFAHGYGGLVRWLFGASSWVGDWPAIVAACGLVCVSACIWRDQRASLYVIGIVGLPLLMVVARLPNLEFPRYFIVSGTLLLLWAAEFLGRGFDAGGTRKSLAVIALALIVIGSISSLLPFFQYGRGSYSAMVETMTAYGDATYASNHQFRTATVVDHFASPTGHRASFVAQDQVCARRPAWFIMEGDPDRQPEQVDEGCNLIYGRTESSTYSGLSGVNWTLYKRYD